jgi:hypothetical protein
VNFFKRIIWKILWVLHPNAQKNWFSQLVFVTHFESQATSMTTTMLVMLDKLHTTIITTTPYLDGKKINEIGFHPLINHMCILICDYVVTHMVTFDN